MPKSMWGFEYTEEQYAKAEARYLADIDKWNKEHPDKPDCSDWVCGLGFVMATYNQELWQHYFAD